MTSPRMETCTEVQGSQSSKCLLHRFIKAYLFHLFNGVKDQREEHDEELRRSVTVLVILAYFLVILSCCQFSSVHLFNDFSLC